MGMVSGVPAPRATCTSRCCDRESLNGQFGQPCCGPCQKSQAKIHSERCETAAPLQAGRLAQRNQQVATPGAATCVTMGCARRSWNAQVGEPCCTLCVSSGGIRHTALCTLAVDSNRSLKSLCS